MARFYTSFTKEKEAKDTVKLLCAVGYMVMRPSIIGQQNAGSRGEWLVSVDTDLGYVSVGERYVYQGAVFIYSTGQMVTRALEEIAQGDMK